MDMGTAVMTHRLELNSVADSALKAAARFWFIVVLIGQFVFASSIASFYSLTALRGGFQAWNTRLLNGYVAGDTLGNSALVGHILFAAVISFAGALQLIPRLRNRFPAFHRWNGRLYLLAAFTQGISGLYLVTSGRKVVGDLSQHVGLWISAALMILCAAMALRYALMRDFKTHRKWALRLFLVASGSWFFRVGLFLSFLIFKGPFGFDPNTFTGPFLTFLTFGEFLLPLAVLELYLYAQEHPGALRRVATAVILAVLTLGIGAGSFAFTMAMSLPALKTAFDDRKSIFSTLSATIASEGVDAAVAQYRSLKSAGAASYNFGEGELNTLGYELLRAKKFKDAVLIFQLNVEAYPQSSNVYDSLGEAYMDDGDKPQAIANYQKSLQLNPKNHNAELMLQKLSAP
jgi:tetratricopeptide (TPR) repeat protein